MKQEQIPQMVAGVKASTAGAGGVLGGSWLSMYYDEIGAICMIVGALCSIGGFIYTVLKGRDK